MTGLPGDVDELRSVLGSSYFDGAEESDGFHPATFVSVVGQEDAPELAAALEQLDRLLESTSGEALDAALGRLGVNWHVEAGGHTTTSFLAFTRRVLWHGLLLAETGLRWERRVELLQRHIPRHTALSRTASRLSRRPPAGTGDSHLREWWLQSEAASAQARQLIGDATEVLTSGRTDEEIDRLLHELGLTVELDLPAPSGRTLLERLVEALAPVARADEG